MSDDCPVIIGQRFKSLRNKRVVAVTEVKRFEDPPAWCAKVETRPGFMKWVTCSKDGLKGYRRHDP